MNKHKKPLKDDDFGYYLAGLIEGNGHFTINHNIEISFNINDASLAYYIKKRIGYGVIKKIKNNDLTLKYISNFKGTIIIAKLINGKLRTNKIEYFNLNIINYINIQFNIPLIIYSKDISNILDNYWLVGFTDANGSFKICEYNKNLGFEFKLKFILFQINNLILNDLISIFDGYLDFNKKLDIYFFCTSSFNSAKKIINYFDKYHLLSFKYVLYFKWRKIYRIIQRKEHLTFKGINKIKKIKSIPKGW